MSFYSYPVHLVLGLIIWSIWFVLIYALLSVGCAIDGRSLWINGVILCCTVLALYLLSYLAQKIWKSNKAAYQKSALKRFIVWVSIATYLIAITATLSIGIMALFLKPCL